MPTTTNTGTDKLIAIQYQVEAPTLEQIVALETLTPRLGPTATMFLIRAAVRCANGSFYEQHTAGELAKSLGLGQLLSTLYKQIRRLERFHIITWDDSTIVIDRWPSHTPS